MIAGALVISNAQRNKNIIRNYRTCPARGKVHDLHSGPSDYKSSVLTKILEKERGKTTRSDLYLR